MQHSTTQHSTAQHSQARRRVKSAGLRPYGNSRVSRLESRDFSRMDPDVNRYINNHDPLHLVCGYAQRVLVLNSLLSVVSRAGSIPSSRKFHSI